MWCRPPMGQASLPCSERDWGGSPGRCSIFAGKFFRRRILPRILRMAVALPTIAARMGDGLSFTVVPRALFKTGMCTDTELFYG